MICFLKIKYAVSNQNDAKLNKKNTTKMKMTKNFKKYTIDIINGYVYVKEYNNF